LGFIFALGKLKSKFIPKNSVTPFPLKKISILILLISALSVGVFAQTQDSYEYQSEFTWGITKNTSSGLIGGFTFKKARKLKNKDNVLETFGLEVINVKHPQEVRVTSVQTGNFYVFGKSNYLYTFRFQYGRDVILFKKAPQQGVEIKGVFAVGPSLGLQAPYYVEYTGDNSSFNSQTGQYNPEINAQQILGTGRLFEGLGDSKVKIGGNFKAAVNFELGTIKSQVTGFETGFLLDAYTSKIEQMPAAKKYSVYPTLFITLFYGSRK
jgi:hypothetical protein